MGKMKAQIQVAEFHRAFGVKIEDAPVMPDLATRKLRLDLIKEEFEELSEAFGLDYSEYFGWEETRAGATSLEDVADAIGDLLYVIYGTAISCGINMAPIFDEIHRSNMSKVCPDGSILRRADGKILKPETYSPADLGLILRDQQYR